MLTLRSDQGLSYPPAPYYPTSIILIDQPSFMARCRSKNPSLMRFEEHYTSFVCDNIDSITSINDLPKIIMPFSYNAKLNHHLTRELKRSVSQLIIDTSRISKQKQYRKRTDEDLVVNDGVARPTSINDLSDYMLMDIHARLPLKSLCRCRCVCKGWSSILLNPEFTKLNFEKSPICLLFRNYSMEQQDDDDGLIDPTRPSRKLGLFGFEGGDDLKVQGTLVLETVFQLPKEHRFCLEPVVNSCNGFLCLQGLCGDKRDEYVVAIYNPVTAEYSILPVPEDGVLVCGLGFCSRSNQYKVLLMRNLKSNCNRCDISSNCSTKVAMIYTLGKGRRCRRITNPPCFECCSIFKPIFLNGALYWLVQSSDSVKGIMSFDFENENFRIIPSSLGLNNTKEDQSLLYRYMTLADSDITLGLVRGNLYLSLSVNSYLIDIWVMKDNGKEKSWRKEYVINGLDGAKSLSPFGLSQVTGLTNKWDMLLYSPKRRFIYFIDEHQAIRHLKIDEAKPNFEVFSYVPSYLSLKNIVGDSIDVLKVGSA